MAADWSADSRRLATGSNDGTAKVWEVVPGGVREALTISAQERGGGLWVAFSPDGERLMTGDQGITAVKIWDVGRRGGAEWANLALAAGPIGGVAFSADGRRVVAAPEGGSITVADAQTGEPGFVLRGFPRASDAASIGVSRDGTLAAAVGDTLRTWDLDSRREGYRVRIAGGVVGLAWAPDGTQLATAGGDGVIRVLDRTGKVVAELPDERGHRFSDLSFSPDGRLIAGARLSLERPGAGAERVTLWDWKRGEIVRDAPRRRVRAGFLTRRRARRHRRAGRAGAHPRGPRRPPARAARAVTPERSTTSPSLRTTRWSRRRAPTARCGCGIPDSGRQALVLRGHERDVWDLDVQPRRVQARLGRPGRLRARVGARPRRPDRDRQAQRHPRHHSRRMPAVPARPRLLTPGFLKRLHLRSPLGNQAIQGGPPPEAIEAVRPARPPEAALRALLVSMEY